jgi:hypothetical protein
MTADKHISGKTPPPQDQTSEATQSQPVSWIERSTMVLEKLTRTRGAIAVFSSAAKMSWDNTRIGLEHAAHHLQLMAASIQSELEESELLWDSIESPPCNGTDLGVYAAERFMASIEALLWIEMGSTGPSQSLPDFGDMGHAADIAREQLDGAIQALSAAIKLAPPVGSIKPVAALEVSPSVVKEPEVAVKVARKAQAPMANKPLEMEV